MATSPGMLVRGAPSAGSVTSIDSTSSASSIISAASETAESSVKYTKVKDEKGRTRYEFGTIQNFDSYQEMQATATKVAKKIAKVEKSVIEYEICVLQQRKIDQWEDRSSTQDIVPMETVYAVCDHRWDIVKIGDTRNYYYGILYLKVTLIK